MKNILITCLMIITLASCSKETSKIFPPTVSSISPTTGGFNSQLTITGTNFSDIPSENQVTINGVPSRVLRSTSTTLTVMVPALKEGALPVNVTTSGGTATGPSFTYMYTVYVAGFENGVAKYWKNGVATSLTDGTQFASANAILVDSTGIYVAGYDGNDIKYWKNGVATTLLNKTNDLSPKKFLITGNDVYVAGFYQTKALSIKNSTVTFLTNGSYFAAANSMYVSGNDVYAIGYENSIQHPIAKYWKNGVEVDLTNGVNAAFAQAMAIDNNNNIFVAGYEFDSDYGFSVAKYWKNGNAVKLSDGTKDEYTEEIAVAGQDVYVIGEENTGISVAKYWKNGVATILTNGQNDAATNAVFVINNDVYVAGYELNNNNIFVAKYWKNGNAQPLTDGMKGAEAEAIYVI